MCFYFNYNLEKYILFLSGHIEPKKKTEFSSLLNTLLGKQSLSACCMFAKIEANFLNIFLWIDEGGKGGKFVVQVVSIFPTYKEWKYEKVLVITN